MVIQHQMTLDQPQTVAELGQEIRDTYMALREARRDRRRSKAHNQRYLAIERRLAELQTKGYKLQFTTTEG